MSSSQRKGNVLICVPIDIHWFNLIFFKQILFLESLLDASCQQYYSTYNGDLYGCLTDNEDYLTLKNKSQELCKNRDISVISDINIYLSKNSSDQQRSKPCVQKPTGLSHFQYNSSCLMRTHSEAFKDFIYQFFTSLSGKYSNDLNLEAKLRVPEELQFNNTYIDIRWDCIAGKF